MSAIRFDEAGLHEGGGLKRAVAPLRRVLARILRPMLVQMADALQSFSSRLDAAERRLDEMDGRHDRQNDQLQATISFGWDYVATTRRLAALEDQVARCLAAQASARDADGQMTLAFPDLVAAEPSALAS